MSSFLMQSANDTGWLTTRQQTKAQRERTRTELEVYRHGLQARALSLMDQQDSAAVADATTVAFEGEMGLLDVGLARASQSAVGRELLGQKVVLLSNMNNRRIARRFG